MKYIHDITESWMRFVDENIENLAQNETMVVNEKVRYLRSETKPN